MKKLLSYFVIVCSLVVVSIGVVVYSQLTDLENLKITLAHKIGELTQSQVYIGEAILDLDQGIGVKLKNVSLSKSANGTPAMEAQEILVVIKIFPLLFREVVIEKLVMVGSSIKLTRKPDGTFGILGMEGLLAQKNFFEKDITSIIKMGFTSQLIIQESEVEFVDYFERTQPSHIPLKNIRFSIQKAFKKSQFGFSFQGEIPHPEGVSHIALSGKLKNPSGGLDLSGFLADGKITLHEIPLPQFESYLRKGFAFKPGDMTVSLESRFSATLLGPKRFSGNLKYQD
ncbi:MAG: hypothetical protein VYC17_04465 [Nitrospinota bacterium]|nr:hypothetical protein [Nitrospinota bacterium]